MCGGGNPAQPARDIQAGGDQQARAPLGESARDIGRLRGVEASGKHEDGGGASGGGKTGNLVALRRVERISARTIDQHGGVILTAGEGTGEGHGMACDDQRQS